MERANERDRAAYLLAVLAIDEARDKNETAPRWAVLVAREWSDMPEPVDVE